MRAESGCAVYVRYMSIGSAPSLLAQDGPCKAEVRQPVVRICGFRPAMRSPTVINIAIYCAALCGCVSSSSVFGVSPGPGTGTRLFSSFAEVRDEILNSIAVAEKHVAIASAAFVDPEIGTALYLAKYRRLSVSVILPERGSRNFDAGVDFLTKNNVPLSFINRPAGEPVMHLVLCDDVLLRIEGDVARVANGAKIMVNYQRVRAESPREFLLTLLRASLVANGSSVGISDSSQTTSVRRYVLSPRQKHPPPHIARKLPKTPLWIKKAAEGEAETETCPRACPPLVRRQGARP